MMKRWEHVVLHFLPDMPNISDKLSKLGAEGWELVAFHRFVWSPRPRHARMMVEVAMKREMVEDDPAEEDVDAYLERMEAQS